ncbi:hypothetical protein TWF694_005168 [Orbilia ellipsospora]|uniref:BHLH domain-containing protein n=1 Tax=Orbilia ellipsospora TaxID=2528407 RepID=A0AAV9WXB6_9PEZI
MDADMKYKPRSTSHPPSDYPPEIWQFALDASHGENLASFPESIRYAQALNAISNNSYIYDFETSEAAQEQYLDDLNYLYWRSDPNLLSSQISEEPVVNSNRVLQYSVCDPSNGAPAISREEPKNVLVRKTKSRTSATQSSKTKEKSDQKKSIKQAACDIQMAKKVAHTVVEKRYREGLNAKYSSLRDELAKAYENESINLASDVNGQLFLVENLMGESRAEVLADAVKFVHHSQRQKREMTNEIEYLKNRIQTLENLVKCGDCSLWRAMRGEGSR